MGHRRLELGRFDERCASSSIPRPVGAILGGGSPDGPLDRVALEVSPQERMLLDLVGRHPFLSAESLATVLGWETRRARERRARLIRRGLISLLDASEAGAWPADELTELTESGLRFLAAQQGLSLVGAVRFNGLAGGGPARPMGTRELLLRNLDHTVGTDAIFVHLRGTLSNGGVSRDDAVLEWRNAAACSRRRVRPDGYAMIRLGGRLYGFFLEYDRGTMSARDYAKKWAAYYDYRDSRDFERDYDGFPTILVVTTDNTVEERIARTARAASVGRSPALPILLTCEWRITRDPANSRGLLGSIWREPFPGRRERVCWPAPSAKMTVRSP